MFLAAHSRRAAKLFMIKFVFLAHSSSKFASLVFSVNIGGFGRHWRVPPPLKNGLLQCSQSRSEVRRKKWFRNILRHLVYC